MEVEKDLTTLKNALYQKRELKKKFNKADQIISLSDKKIIKQFFIQLIHRKRVYLRTQSINSDWMCQKLKYDDQIILEMDDLITKYRDVRTTFSDQKRKWML